MTETFQSRVRDGFLALFPRSPAERRKPALPADTSEDEDESNRAAARDEDFHRLWAMHGHW